MTELEARCLVERWMQEYSPFKAEVIHLRPALNGNWVVVVEYSTEVSLESLREATNASSTKDERRH